MKNSLGNKQIMARNIRHYMELHGKSRNDMCEALGVKYTTFTDWVNGKTYPRIDKIELMANYFGITKAALVEDTDYTSQTSADAETPAPKYYLNDETAAMAQDIFENKELRLLFDAARDAEPEDLETVHSMLLALKRKEQNRD